MTVDSGDNATKPVSGAVIPVTNLTAIENIAIVTEPTPSVNGYCQGTATEAIKGYYQNQQLQAEAIRKSRGDNWAFASHHPDGSPIDPFERQIWNESGNCWDGTWIRRHGWGQTSPAAAAKGSSWEIHLGGRVLRANPNHDEHRPRQFSPALGAIRRPIPSRNSKSRGVAKFYRPAHQSHGRNIRDIGQPRADIKLGFSRCFWLRVAGRRRGESKAHNGSVPADFGKLVRH